MHLDPISRMWKEDDNDYRPPKMEPEENDTEMRPAKPPERKKPEIQGKCVLSIRFENHGEYLKWKKYNGERQWDFPVNYPALMRAEYSFCSALDVEIMTRKIIQLLEMGFDVYSAGWSLEKNQDGIANETTP